MSLKNTGVKYPVGVTAQQRRAQVTDGLTTLQSTSFSAPYTAGAAILAGEFVRISAADTVVLALATTDAGAAAIGAADVDIALGFAGSIITVPGSFVINAQFETGLVVLAGNKVWLSAATAGAITNVPPSVLGNRAKAMGQVVDASAYVGGVPANSKADIVYIPEEVIIIG